MTKTDTQLTQKKPQPVAPQKRDAFKQTLSQARSHLSTPHKAFSHVVHARAIEVLSDTLGGSLFRPTAITIGSLSALLFTSTLYFTAKHYGYELAGSEFLVAFGFGWLVGIIIDYTLLLTRSVTKKRR